MKVIRVTSPIYMTFYSTIDAQHLISSQSDKQLETIE